MWYRIFGENVNGIWDLRSDKTGYRIGKSIIFAPGTLMATGNLDQKLTGRGILRNP